MTIINFPDEFNKFINLFYGLPVDFSKPQIKMCEYDGREFITAVESDNVQSTIVKFGDSSQCEVVIKYVSYINHEVLERNLINRDKEFEDLKDNLRGDGYTEKDIKYWTEDELPLAKIRKQNAEKWNNKRVPCDFEGYVVTPDLSISYNGDLFQAMIGPGDDERIIILYGTPDQNGQLQQLTMCTYGSIFDFIEDYSAYADYGNPQSIYPSNIAELKKTWQSYRVDDSISFDDLVTRIEFLKSIGVNPEIQLDIDFQQFLVENGLESTHEHPLAAIFMAKKALMELIAQLEEKKQKQ